MPPPSKRGARGGIGPRERNKPIFRRFLPPLRCVAAADLHGGNRQDGPGSPWGLPCPTTMAQRRHASKAPGSITAHAPASSRCFLRVFAPWPCNLVSHLVINLAEYSAPTLSPPRQRQRKRLRKLPIFTSFSRRTSLCRRPKLLRSARIQENFSPSRAIDGRIDANLSPLYAPASLIRAPAPQFSPKTPKKLAHSPKLPIVTSD